MKHVCTIKFDCLKNSSYVIKQVSRAIGHFEVVRETGSASSRMGPFWGTLSCFLALST